MTRAVTTRPLTPRPGATRPRSARSLAGLAGLFLATAMGQALISDAALAHRALVVGIDTYADSRLTFALQGASKRDADRFRKVLIDTQGFKPEEIMVLRDGEATRANILGAFETWLGQTKPGEKVAFYYVGHGHFTKDLNGDEADGTDETLVPHDAKLRSDGGQVAVDNQITDDEIGAALDRLKGRKILVVVDACHSGTVTRSINPGVNQAARAPQLLAFSRSIADPGIAKLKSDGRFLSRSAGAGGEGDVTVWTAVAATQVALINEEAAPNYHGVFTAAFADGIEGGAADTNGDGVVSNAELLAFTRKRSDEYCARNPKRCELGLTPTLEGRGAAAKVAAVVQKGAPAPQPAVAAGPTPKPETPPKGAEAPRPEPGDSLAAGKPNLDKVLSILGAEVSDRVQVRQTPPSPVALGARDIRFSVTSPADGFLVLLSLSAEGDLVQLFPNQFTAKTNKDGRIRAGAPVTVPDASYGMRIDATSPTAGHVIALVAQEPLKLPERFVARKIDVIPADEVANDTLPTLADAVSAPAQTETVSLNTKGIERLVGVLPYAIVKP